MEMGLYDIIMPREALVDQLNIAVAKYARLKEEEKALQAKIKKCQQELEKLFGLLELRQHVYGGYKLYRQERGSISYPDTPEFKAFLKERGLWDLAVSVDVTKLARLIKSKFIQPEELFPFQHEKVTHAWVLERIENAGNGEGDNQV